MVQAIAWLGTLVVSFFTKQVTLEIVKFLAYKALLLILFFGMAVVLRGFIMDFMYEMLSAVSAKISTMSGGLHSPTLNLSGGVGAAASYLRIPDCVTVLCTGYTIAFIRSLIPFG